MINQSTLAIVIVVAFVIGAVLIFRTVQDMRSVHKSVKREPLPDHEIVTMYAECPRSDAEMIDFARAIERAHGIGGSDAQAEPKREPLSDERIAEIQRAAYERAAQECIETAAELRRCADGCTDGRYDWKADGALDCADAIRALGGQHD